MKFRRIKKFFGSDIRSVTDYLSGELNKFCGDVQVVLNKLTFLDNFDSFAEDVDFGASATVIIPNRIGSTQIDWIVTRATGDNRIIETSITATQILLKNASATATKARVIFFKR